MKYIEPIPVDARQWPYITYLKVRYPRTPANRVSIGSGCLIGPRVVLTAGHVVYNFRKGGWATAVSATLGSEPRFTVRTNVVRTTRNWKDIDSRLPVPPLESAVDYGVVVLPAAVDMAVRPLPVETASTERLRTSLLNQAGYPSTANGTLYGARAVPVEVTKTRIAYPIATKSGQSGGPVYDYDPDTQQRTVRGIHTSLVPGKGGSAVRVNESVKELIDRWLREFRPA